MPLPTTPTWDLADFSGATFGQMLYLPPGDLTAIPSGDTYFAYNTPETIVYARSNDGIEGSLRFSTGVPSRFTFDVVLKCPQLPHNLGDLNERRFGFTLADDAGRGFTLYLAKTGVAISRVDSYGAATALPDTGDVTTAVGTTSYTIRVAVDGGLGRAYVFVGQGATDTPALRWIIPVEKTPSGASDLFKVFVKGKANEPVLVEISSLRLASGLVLANYPPVADAGPDRVTPIGNAVRFDGRASYDVEGVPLKYAWQCIDAPYGSSFMALASGVSTTDDGDADGTTIFLELEPSALPEWVQAGDIVRIGGLLEVIEGVDTLTGFVTLKGDSIPDDLVNQTVTFIRQSIILDPTLPTPVAVPDLPGLYRFRLIVNDGEVDSEPSEVLANITALQTPVGVEPDVSIIWKAIGDEWRLIPGRDVFEEAWIGAAQILSGKLLEAWQAHYNSSIRDAQQGFLRKWIAYRTMTAEVAPDKSTVSPRYGAFLTEHRFDEGDATVSGLELRVEAIQGDGSFVSATITLGSGTRAAVISAINAALPTAGVYSIAAEPHDTRDGGERIAIFANRAFRLSGSACTALGLPQGSLNELAGTTGVRVTDRVYYVEGVDLVRMGVQRGDLLVLNNGESFVIDRVLNDLSDPGPNRRVLLFDRTPVDSASSWAIPSVIRGSGEVDYEVEGAYPGDLAKTEIYQAASGQVDLANSYVVAQKGAQLAVHLGIAVQAALRTDDEIRFVGVKHRKALRLPDDVLSVPTLQELIAAKLEPTLLREHIDYVLEPFYRDLDARPIPMLQFSDATYITPDLEPPDVLWAETTVFDNQVHIEALFGRLVNFLRDDAASFSQDFNYAAGVAGLLYAQQRGPNLFAMAVGAQILFGQPFAEAAGYIEEIRPNYAPAQGRVLIRDADGKTPTESETIRAYYYKKIPSDLSELSGLAINPDTNQVWTVGEYIPQFSAIGAGVDIDDIYTKPKWWRSYVGSGVMYEVEKFHRFVCTFDLAVVDLANLSLLFSLLMRIKPTYSRPMLVGTQKKVDDLDIDDTVNPQPCLLPYDTLLGRYGARHDDYRGDGTLSVHFDDGYSRCDALIDMPFEVVTLAATISWPGGTLSFPTEWPFRLDTAVTDVSGAETGTPGQSFSVTNGMDLAAGTYVTLLVIKDQPILPPL